MRGFLVALALVYGSQLAAQERSDGWSIGGIAAVGQSIYVGEDGGGIVVPAVRYKRGDWTYGLDGVTGRIWDDGPASVEFMVKPRFPEMSDGTPELAGIDRTITGDAGAKLSYDLGADTTLAITALQEVTDAHHGQEIEVFVERKVAVGPVPFWLSGALTWQSADLAGYLYGVGASESRPGRPAYDPGAALIPSVAIATGYPLTKTGLLFGVLGYRALPSAVTNSPIVDRRDELSLTTGLTFSF